MYPYEAFVSNKLSLLQPASRKLFNNANITKGHNALAYDFYKKL